MDQLDVLYPNCQMTNVHKGWQEYQKRAPSSMNRKIVISIRPELTPAQHEKRAPSMATAKGKKGNQLDVLPRFEFVSTSGPTSNKDPSTRKLVRTHVMREVSREKRLQRQKWLDSFTTKRPSPSTEDEQTSHELSTAFHVPVANKALGASIEGCLSTFPIPMQSHLYTVILRGLGTFSTAMYPMESWLRFNPIKAANCLQISMTDVPLFHAFLYGCALYRDLAEGTATSTDTEIQKAQIVTLISKRLAVSSETELVSEATVGAVSCLGLGEALTGNFQSWQIHSNGIRQMVNARGGLSKLNPILKFKILRVDITGSVNFLAPPTFAIHRSDHPAIHTALDSPWTTHPRSNAALLSENNISPSLADLFDDLEYFSQAVDNVMCHHSVVRDPGAFIKTSYSILYGLLTVPSTFSSSSSQTTTSRNTSHINSTISNSSNTPLSPYEEPTRLAALLYMKSILNEFPQSMIGWRNLTRKLRQCLTEAFQQEPFHSFSSYSSSFLASSSSPSESSSSSLIIWLLFIGGISCRDPLTMSSDRAWFVACLAKLLSRPGVVSASSSSMMMMDAKSEAELQVGLKSRTRTWEEVKSLLRGVLWIEPIHSSDAEALWGEVCAF